ncbi:hypothetical protein BH09MYX1_BH09MYX1_34530 [soil metagenome]
MKNVAGTALLALVTLGIATVACKKEDDAPTPITPTATATAYPPATGYPTANGYPTATATGYPTATATGYPTATAPVGATMAVPGLGALPCQNDSGCGFARCNVQYQKCAFPCVNAAVDCIAGTQCLVGACVPKAPGQQ